MFGKSFYDKYGNFDNSKFITLLEKTKKAQENTKNKKKGNINQDIALFNSVSKKELWQFINKLAIFMNSGIDVKGAL
jgi:type II secretory pathway component PulF